MSRKTQKMIRKMFPYLSVLVIGALIVAGVAIFAVPDKNHTKETESGQETQNGAEPENGETVSESTDPSGETLNTDAETADPSDATSAESTAEETEPSEVEYAVSAVDAVNVDSLISDYYEAKADGDAEKLNDLVDSETSYDEAEMAYEPEQFIEKYDNFKTYIIPGVTEDYFVAYVRYDIFFKGIRTGAPALNHYIVQKNENGEYAIYDKELTEEFQNYLDESEKTDIVIKLKDQVNEDLEKACQEDMDLKYLIGILNGEEEETAEETTEAEKKSKKKKSKKNKETAGEAETETPEGEEAPAEGNADDGAADSGEETEAPQNEGGGDS